MLSIIRSKVTGEQIDLSGVDCRRLLKEAAAQTVVITVYDVLGRIKSVCADEIKTRAMLNLAANAQTGYAQNRLIRLLNDNKLSYIILKGEAAAAYYPNPQLRSLGDVDFLIDPAEQEKVERVLLDAGYTKSHDGHICHRVFQKPGAHLEMHFEPSGIPNGAVGERIRGFMRSALAHSTEKDVGNGSFRAPDDLYHAVILLLHMQHHMLGEGIGLRHLCDWAYFVNKTMDLPFWNELLPFLREIGLFHYAAVMSKTSAVYLGVSCPVWAEEIPEELCAEIMEDIFAGGNFGKKDPARSQGSFLISNRGKNGTGHGKAYYLFYGLNAYVKERFYKWRRVWIMYPVLYVCAGARYLHRLIQGKRIPLHKLASAADKRKSIYNNLHLFETE